MVEAMTTALTGIATDFTSMIGAILPIALGVVGSVMVVTFGIKFFHKITGK